MPPTPRRGDLLSEQTTADAPTVDVHVLVLAKSPVAGRVKTRLCPPFTPAEAAALAEAALVDTLGAVGAAPVAGRSIVLDGEPGPWLSPAFAIVAQRGDGLDERLAAAFEDGAGAGLPLLLVGMDTPQVSGEEVAAAGRRLLRPGTDAVLGLASDGGWWALGLRRSDPRLLLGVPMCEPTTGAAQLHRLRAHGLRVDLLARHVDVDTAADAAAVAAAAPRSRFASTLRSIAAGRRP